MSELLIAGGTVVTADRMEPGDVLIRDGRIAATGAGLRTGGEVLDARGHWVMPGGIDTHTHIAHPVDRLGITTADDFFTGTLAGACGGVTTILDFSLQRRGESLDRARGRRLREIEPDAVTDYGFHTIVTDVRDDVLDEIPRLIEDGFPSFKVYMTYGDKIVDDAGLLRLLEVSWPETCPQYLVLDDSVYDPSAYDPSVYDPEARFEVAKFVCSPPVRAGEHCEALWRALEAGSIQQVSSDHAPFRYKDQKTKGRGDFTRIPNGLPGIETRLPLLFTAGVTTGRLSPQRFVELAATGPARIFGLYPRKGTLDAGADADVIVVDPDAEVEIDAAKLHSAVDYSPYQGMRVKGFPTWTISRGEVIVERGEPVAKRGRGRLAPLSRDRLTQALVIDDMCAVRGRLMVHSSSSGAEGRIVHEMSADDGSVVASFGESYRSDFARDRQDRSYGRIACGDDPATIVWGSYYFPIVKAFGPNDALLWWALIEDFVQPLIYQNNAASPTVYPQGRSAEYVVGTHALRPGFVVLQTLLYGDRPPIIGDPPVIRPQPVIRRRTYLIDQETGNGGLVSDSLPRIAWIGDSTFVASWTDPYPKVEVRAFPAASRRVVDR